MNTGLVSNELGQPIGDALPNWVAPDVPYVDVLEGSHVRLERLTAEHAQDLFEAFSAESNAATWTYLPYGPFDSIDDLTKGSVYVCAYRFKNR